MESKKNVRKKLKLHYKLLFIIIIILAVLFMWAKYIGTSGLIIKEYKVTSNDLPISFNGLKIIQISDIHYGRIIKNNRLKQIVKEVNILKPDIVVFTGDLIDKDIKITSLIKNDVIKNLSNIETKYGKYAIRGNHDFTYKSYSNILEQSGFINLDSSYDIIFNQNNDAIFLGGLESEIKGKPDIDKVMSYYNDTNNILPTYKILIMHTPDTFDKTRKYNFNLALAGHSHNGQVRLPFIGTLRTPLKAKIYYEPYYKINNTDFYISGGLGTSEMDLRFFNKPSFNFFRIVKR